jgi:hypothetical protein
VSDYLWVQEQFVNATENTRYGESPVYETYFDSIGRLFRSCQKEWGACVSKVYITVKDESEPSGWDEAMPIGWVFQKRVEYEERSPRYDDYGRIKPRETYIREVWVIVHEAPDTVVRTPHYVDLRKRHE